MVAQAIKNQIEKIEYREKKIFWMLFSLFVLLIISYGFLVERTIQNAVAKQKLESQISSLNSNVDSMEFTYISLENNITMDFALSKGFTAVPENNFAVIVPAKSGLALSLNEN